MGLEGRVQAGGTREAVRRCLTSRMVVFCLPHIFLFCSLPSEGKPCLSEANRSSPTASCIGHKTSVADKQEIFPPSTFLECLAESLALPYLPLRSNSMCFLFTHLPGKEKIRPGLVGEKGRMTSCSLKLEKTSQYPWQSTRPLPLQGGSVDSPA